MNWANDTDRETEAAKVVTALEKIGLKATAITVHGKKTGGYRIHR